MPNSQSMIPVMAEFTGLSYNGSMNNSLYEYTQSYIRDCFQEEKVLRRTPEGTIRRLRHTGSRKLYVCREFEGDADAVRKLIGVSCAHLPHVYEAAGKDGHVIVLEEYIPGDNLADICRDCTLESEQVRRIALDVCDALYALHSQGLVHRDVKPENVILDGDRSVLIDFNAIREASEKKEHDNDTRILGTVGYAPPEQYGLSQTDRRADIFALGILINVLLTGKHPSLQLASGSWGRIVSRCTMTSPGKRYQTVQAVREAL